MSEKPPLARIVPGRLIGRRQPEGKETFRIVGPNDEPLMTRDLVPVDNGGIIGENLAKMRADEINDYYAKQAEAESD